MVKGFVVVKPLGVPAPVGNISHRPIVPVVSISGFDGALLDKRVQCGGI